MNQKVRRLLIIPAIAIGVVVFMLMTKGKSEAPREEQGELATPVRFVTVQAQDVVPQAIGNGNVMPARVWSAVSQVQGRVIELPPRYRKGMIIRQGDRLLRIDDSDYQLDLAQAKASILAIQAQIKQLDARKRNLNNSIKIEQESLESAEKELERLNKLIKQGTVSVSSLESQRRAYLAQKQQLQNLTNSLTLLPSDREVLNAQLAQQQAQLDLAQLNLQRTEIVAPFNARLAELNVEQDQYIRVGEVIAVLDDMDQAEVEAQFPLDHFSQLVQPLDIKAMMAESETPGPHLLDIAAMVRVQRNRQVNEWPAQFVRTDAGIDAQTRTVGAVVKVDDPYTGAMPPLRPPLVKGTYVSVVLEGQPKADQIAIPRQALHGNVVYVISGENRLERRQVEVGLRQPGFVTLTAGLKSQERIIVSDLIPAVDGMLLAPVEDEGTSVALNMAVLGSLGRLNRTGE